jgi:hypothetical protein
MTRLNSAAPSGGKCLRRLLLGRWGNLAELDQPLLHRGVGECGTDDAVELHDDVVRGFLGGPDG